MKQILKNLWSQRAQNVWLFAELVVVCFVAWTQIDPIAVRLFYQNQPAGFDIDRLVVADARLYKSMSQNTHGTIDEETYDQMEERSTQEMKQLKQHLLELDEVAYVSFLDGIEGYPRMNKSYTDIPLPNDTITVPWCYFDIGQDFFETFGIKPLPGSPSQHDLSMNTGGGQSLILTRSLAERIYGSAEAAIGKNLDSGWTYVVEGNKTSIIYTILGVVEDVGARTDEYSTWMAFSPNGWFSNNQQMARLVIRLKPEVNMQRFVEEQTYRTGELASEHYVICEFFPYVDAAKNIDSVHSADFNAQSDYDFNLSVATAIFFLINLCLGVIGTFWMQTKHHGLVPRRGLRAHDHQHAHHLCALHQLCEDRIRGVVHPLFHTARPNMGGRQTPALPHHLRHRLSHHPPNRFHRHPHPIVEHRQDKTCGGAERRIEDPLCPKGHLPRRGGDQAGCKGV